MSPSEGIICLEIYCVGAVLFSHILSEVSCTSLVLITTLCKLVADGREGLLRMDSRVLFWKLTVLQLVPEAIGIYSDML